MREVEIANDGVVAMWVSVVVMCRRGGRGAPVAVDRMTDALD